MQAAQPRGFVTLFQSSFKLKALFHCCADASAFVVRDAEFEAKFRFSLPDTLHKASQKRLLSGMSVMLCESIKPPPAEMRLIVEAAGGTVIVQLELNMPNTVIIAAPQDIGKKMKSRNIPVCYCMPAS